METKFTPGPWSIKYNNDIIERVKPSSKISGLSIYASTALTKIAEITLNIIGTGVKKKFDGDVTEANANLIAAAPDLLDALTELLECDYTSGTHLNSAQERAKAAITKAIGK